MSAHSNAAGNSTGRGSYAPIPPTPENIRAALSYLSPDIPHEDWARVAMAVHDGLNGEGFPLFDEWSKNGQTYTPAAARDTWKSIKSGGGVTIGTLWGIALDKGWKPDSNAHQETEAERLERERKRKAQAEQDAKDKARKEREAAQKTMELWKAATQMKSDHPYFARKLPGIVPSPTLREIPAGQAAKILGYAPKWHEEPLAGRLIVVPVKIGDKLTTAELIDENGRKSAIAGGPKLGGHWAAQRLPEDDGVGLTLLLGEGVATALSAKAAHGHLALAALSAGNLANVAKAMRKRYPAADIVILADLAKQTGEADPHAIKAAQAVGGLLAVPDFGSDRPAGLKDFNDLHQMQGLDAVRNALIKAKAPDVAIHNEEGGVIPTPNWQDSVQPHNISDAGGKRQPTRTVPGFILQTAAEIAVQPFQPHRIKGIFPKTGIAAIFGPSGSGKTFVKLSMAAAIGAGLDWFGYHTKAGPVVCVELEGEGGLRNRIAAYRTAHGSDSLNGVRFVTGTMDLRTADVEGLIEAIKAAGMESPTIFIDTLNRAAPGADENSSSDMGLVIASVKRLQAATDGLVVLVHHTGKDATKGMRGHSSLFAALDTAIEVTRNGDDMRAWKLAKSKDGEDGKSHGFNLRVIGLGEDADGDPITSCVIEPNGSALVPGGTKAALPTLNRKGAAALGVLHDLYERRRSALAEGGTSGCAAVPYEDWCAAMRGMPKNRASEGRSDVLKKGYARTEGAYVHLVPVPPGSFSVPPGTPGTAGKGSVPVPPPLKGVEPGTGTVEPGVDAGAAPGKLAR